MKLPELFVQIPPQRIAQASEAARVLGEEVYRKFPFAGTTKPMVEDLGQMVLNRTWRPQLATVGMAGYPEPVDAGNVLLPYTEAKISVRTPPTLDAKEAVKAMKKALESDPPYGATVEFDAGEGGQSGWHAPPLAPWLEKAVTDASQEAFGQPVAYMGEGGTIPFMGMLGDKFPEDAVRDHRRAGPAFECAWAERVPAHSDGEEGDGGDRADDRGALRAEEVAILPPPHSARGRGLGDEGAYARRL